MHWMFLIVVSLMLPVSSVRAEDKPASKHSVEPPGFVDTDKDGINDRFHDANGDGINDVTGKPYPHRFGFRDDNKDRINDLFVDRDGDGVNDLGVRFVDTDKDGINDNVIDVDRDRINDITGHRYRDRALDGGRYGCVNEEKEEYRSGFIDEDGDGIDDREQGGKVGRRGDTMHDYFIDEDGDGICDGREIGGRHRGRSGQRGMGMGHHGGRR